MIRSRSFCKLWATDKADSDNKNKKNTQGNKLNKNIFTRGH